MSYEWISIIAAIITGISTIIAVYFAWKLTKKGLYDYQQRQDMKKEEVRLIQNVMTISSKTMESLLRLVMSLQKQDLPEDTAENLIQTIVILTEYDLILEEIKTIFSITSSTFKSYKEKISKAGTTLSMLLLSEKIDITQLFNKFYDEISKLNKNLVDLIHLKTKKKLDKIKAKKKNQER